MTDLADAIATTVRTLGSAHSTTLATAYRGTGAFTPAGAAAARQAVPAPHRDQVDRLNSAWAEARDVAGSAIATALEAVQAAVQLADGPKIEVVVTGPDSPAAPVRLTSEVVRQLINQATQRVTIVSFAAYRVTSVITALDAACARGVSVSLILESPDQLQGGGGGQAYSKYQVFQWPLAERAPDAKLHAKAIIVDGTDVLLTSANMTNAAFDKNIELGLLCRGGGVARQVQSHFDELIARGVLRQVA